MSKYNVKPNREDIHFEIGSKQICCFQRKTFILVRFSALALKIFFNQVEVLKYFTQNPSSWCVSASSIRLYAYNFFQEYSDFLILSFR